MSLALTIESPRHDMWDRLLQQFSKRARAKTDKDIQRETALLKEDIQEGWPVLTGASRAAWSGPFKVAEGHHRLINPMAYANAIEYGTYPGVGPKTEAVGGQTLPGGVPVGPGIFPTQVPAAPVRQAMSKRRLAWAQGKFGGR